MPKEWRRLALGPVTVCKAVELGASNEEIAEALGTAIALNAGAALTYTARVFDTIKALPKQLQE